MPQIVQIILSTAAVVVALGVLWQKVFLPGFRAANRADKLIETVTTIEKLLPTLTAIATQLGDATELLPVVKEIAEQFKSDAGSTLKDQLNEHDKLLAELKLSLQRIEAGDAIVATNLKKKEEK